MRIQNFCSYTDETIPFGDYTCFVGPNGSGTSTILHALNVFSSDRDCLTDVTRLSENDYQTLNSQLDNRVIFRDLKARRSV